MATTIVVISGKQGSGKSTLQQKLVESWQTKPGHRAFALNFADPIYEMHNAVRAVARRYKLPIPEPKDGRLLQLLGTEWGRSTLGRTVWIDCVKEKIRELAEENDHYSDLLFIIGDCRMVNEFDAFPEALRVRLSCVKDVRQERCTNWRDNDGHPSEVELDRHERNYAFDLMIDTWITPPAGCADLVMAQLLKNVWLEKRPSEVAAV